MSDVTTLTDRAKKDRSPSFPFISLRRAVERAEQFAIAHKKDAARLPTIAPTWGYGAKSSGLLQTVAALKQFGLIEDSGSGEERRVKLSDLARSIIGDTRPGIKAKSLATAAKKPKLFEEYIARWVPDCPADNHCVSELEHDRGFTPEAAKAFLKAFKITIAYAGLQAADSLSSHLDHDPEREEESEVETQHAVMPPPTPQAAALGFALPVAHDASVPFGRRYQVTMADNKLTISATLVAPAEVDKLIRLLEANKALLEDMRSEEPNGG